MLHYEPKNLSVPEVHRLLLGGVAPRPIALVSTISSTGINNLSPFSFFNAFGANPPIVAFSPSRRGRDASFKDTYLNLKDTGECVIQSVTYDMVEQINLASTEYPSDVDEFVKSGLTPIASDLVKPKRVKESPFQMECKVRDLLSYGAGGASANMAVCEVIKFHVAEDIFKDGIIHPDKINLVARMSGDFYTKTGGDSIFILEKPTRKFGIGYNKLPECIKNSIVFSANDLGKLAGINALPSNDEIRNFVAEIESSEMENFELSEEALDRYQRNKEYPKMFKALISLKKINSPINKFMFEQCAKAALDSGDLIFAWRTLLFANL